MFCLATAGTDAPYGATGGMHCVANLAIFLKKPPSLSTFFESAWVSVAD